MPQEKNTGADWKFSPERETGLFPVFREKKRSVTAKNCLITCLRQSTNRGRWPKCLGENHERASVSYPNLKKSKSWSYWVCVVRLLQIFLFIADRSKFRIYLRCLHSCLSLLSMFLKFILSLVPTGGSSSLLYLIFFCVIQNDINCSYRTTRLYFCPLGLRHYFR